MSPPAGELKLRVATLDDADAVSRVLARSYGVLYRGWYRDDVLDAALPAMTRANPALLSSGRYFIVEADGAARACGGWSAGAPGGGAAPGLAHVRHFATDPDYLNRGFGGAMLSRAIDEAGAAGFAEIECVSSLAAEAFYARHGFRQIEMVRQPMGGGEFACVRMRRATEPRP